METRKPVDQPGVHNLIRTRNYLVRLGKARCFFRAPVHHAEQTLPSTDVAQGDPWHIVRPGHFRPFDLPLCANWLALIARGADMFHSSDGYRSWTFGVELRAGCSAFHL